MQLKYICPSTLADATSQLNGDYRIVAGCTDFLPALRQGSSVGRLVDITRVHGLSDIRFVDGMWRIGATATWSEILKYPFPEYFDGLKLAAREVGSVQIQNSGTIAGNICNASPAADGVPPLLALDARLEIRNQETARLVTLGDFLTGVRRTVLQPGDLVTAVLVPALSDRHGSSFVKLGSRKYLVISIAMAAAVIGIDRAGLINDARIAVGACSPVAKRMEGLEAGLLGLPAESLATTLKVSTRHMNCLSPIDDVRGPAGYRLHAAAELCRQAVLKAADRVLDGPGHQRLMRAE